MPTLHDVKGIIQFLDGATSPLLGRREIEELPRILEASERIERVAEGTYGNGRGLIVGTDRRLIFVDKGLFSSLRVEDFPYDKITSIQYKTGIALGQISIFASGNRAEIKNLQKDKARRFAEYTRAKIAKTSQSDEQPRNATAARLDDAISKLERLGALKVQGLLTDEEFLEQKRTLLKCTRSAESEIEPREDENQVAVEQLPQRAPSQTVPDTDSSAKPPLSSVRSSSPNRSSAAAKRHLFWAAVLSVLIVWNIGTLFETPSASSGDEHKSARKFTEDAATSPSNSKGIALQRTPAPQPQESPQPQPSPPLVRDRSPFGTIAQFEASAFSKRYQTKYFGVDHAKTGVRYSPISYRIDLSGVSGAGLNIRDVDGVIIGFGVNFFNDRGLAVPLPWTADMERFALEGLSTFLAKDEAQAVLKYMKAHRLDVDNDGVGNGKLTQLGNLWVAAGTTGGDLSVWVALEDNRSSKFSSSVEENVTQLKVRGKTVMIGDSADSTFATLKPLKVVSQSTEQDPAIRGSLLVVKQYKFDGSLWTLTFRRREAQGEYVLAQIHPASEPVRPQKP